MAGRVSVLRYSLVSFASSFTLKELIVPLPTAIGQYADLVA